MKYIYFILITLFISFQGLSQSSVVWLSYHKPMKGKGSELFDAIKDKTQKYNQGQNDSKTLITGVQIQRRWIIGEIMLLL